MRRQRWRGGAAAGVSRCKGGFSLVELLVVMVIISILAALLLPVLRKAREAAHTMVCANNMRQVFFGLGAYAEDHNQWLPPGQECILQPGTDHWINWGHRINDTPHYGGIYSGGYIPYRTITCPKGVALNQEWNHAQRSGDFGINSILVPRSSTATYRLSKTQRPSRLYLLLDSQNGSNAHPWCKRIYGVNYQVKVRHGSPPQSNVIFMDGHVEARFDAEIPQCRYQGGGSDRIHFLPWGNADQY